MLTPLTRPVVQLPCRWKMEDSWKETGCSRLKPLRNALNQHDNRKCIYKGSCSNRRNVCCFWHRKNIWWKPWFFLTSVFKFTGIFVFLSKKTTCSWWTKLRVMLRNTFGTKGANHTPHYTRCLGVYQWHLDFLKGTYVSEDCLCWKSFLLRHSDFKSNQPTMKRGRFSYNHLWYIIIRHPIKELQQSQHPICFLRCYCKCKSKMPSIKPPFF